MSKKTKHPILGLQDRLAEMGVTYREREPGKTTEFSDHKGEPFPMPMTQAAFERAAPRPENPRELVSLTAKCHRHAGLVIGYNWADGCAWVMCKECGLYVTRLQLASTVPS